MSLNIVIVLMRSAMAKSLMSALTWTFMTRCGWKMGFLYYSKKLSRFVPVKEKNIDTVFLTVSPVGGYSRGEDFDYVLYNEV